MNKHTPGPWGISRRTATGVVAKGERGICSTGGYSDSRVDGATLNAENEANARLISAAPDMLAELERIFNRVIEEDIWYDAIPGSDYVEFDWGELTALKSLIAKARGET